AGGGLPHLHGAVQPDRVAGAGAAVRVQPHRAAAGLSARGQALRRGDGVPGGVRLRTGDAVARAAPGAVAGRGKSRVRPLLPRAGSLWMERAVALAPPIAGNYAALAEVLSCMGRTEEALEAAAQALRLKPVAVDYHLDHVGAVYSVAGHYEEARAALQHYLSYYPNILHPHLILAAVYSEL